MIAEHQIDEDAVAGLYEVCVRLDPGVVGVEGERREKEGQKEGGTHDGP